MAVIRKLNGINAKISLTALARTNEKHYPYLLETRAFAGQRQHFDILFAFPQFILSLNHQNQLSIHNCLSSNSDNNIAPDSSDSNFLEALDRLWRHHNNHQGNLTLPFEGGWFVYLGYELAQQIEPVLNLPAPDSAGMPVAFAARIPCAVIYDHAAQETYVVAEQGYESLIDSVMVDIEGLANRADTDVEQELPLELHDNQLQEEPEQIYLDSLARIKHYIREGDVFQVNLSRLWKGVIRSGHLPLDIYKRLCRSNPAPFACLIRYQDHSVISSSPERLLRVVDNQAETRPIAGTRPRGFTTVEDEGSLRELIGHPKERAEHIMLIDLERNDLGRICVPGSVNVNELMVLETYAHVHHIVSNVQGSLMPEWTPGKLIAAVFPGGTITGCPKIRCMEIIAELEQAPRGAYTGSAGYLNHNGNMDLNILIRTLELSGRTVKLRAGAGIVADSDPERELHETRAKAKGLLLALT